MEGNILASVGGMPITDTDVDRFLAGLGQRAAAYRSPEGRAAILEELINRKLFLMEATRGLFEAEPAFKAQLKEQKEALLISYAMEKALSSVKVTEEEIAAFYDAHKAELGGGETVNASHILVDSEEEAARIRAEILSGAITFEDAARKYSSCPSKEEGGNLGDFGRGQMVPEFEEACFALPDGEISEPVRTQFGYHLIRVNSRKETAAPSLSDVHDEVGAAVLREKQQKAYQSKVNQLRILFPVDRA